MWSLYTLVIITTLQWSIKDIYCVPVGLGNKTVGAENPLLIISLDGFRWNYLERTSTPNFDKFLANGVHAKYGLKNAFVTKTFPNHFTLATGLWEESHNIVANSMYDPQLNQSFSPANASANADPAWFDTGAEPIWVTNEIQKEDGRSGVLMWVGSDAPIKLVRPSRHIAYNRSLGNKTKIDTMVRWLSDDKYPINLGMMYFDEPDGFGHKFGPESEQVTSMIGELDKVIGYLLTRLEEVDLLYKINIIITSDHGFTETPLEKVINLDTFVDPKTYMLVTTSPIASLWPHEGHFEEIFTNLTEAATKSGNFLVFKREDVPEMYHYSRSHRIGPIIAVANDHYSFEFAHELYTNKGNHGYDNRLQDMHPFFVAMGPAFRRGHAVKTFHSVDVYPLMCHLLGLVPAENNGSLEVVAELLEVRPDTMSLITVLTYMIGGIVLATIVSVFIFGVCRHCDAFKYAPVDTESLLGAETSSPGESEETEASEPLLAGDNNS